MGTTVRTRFTSIAILTAIGLGGCSLCEVRANGEEDGVRSVAAIEVANPETKVIRGMLQTGMMGIGGEHSGIELTLDDGTRLEVEPGTNRGVAEGLDGRRVVVTGTLETRGYVERGEVKILRADTILAEGAGDSE